MSAPRNIMPSGNQWIDRRLLELYHTGYAYAAEPPQSREECQERSAFTKAQVLLAAGLDPMPEKFPMHPELMHSFRHEGTNISQFRMEYMPGLFITGNLYEPERVKIQAPGILCPHGHCDNGRLQNDDTESTPLLCMMLARLGFIVLSYDMLGYADSHQLPHRWDEATRREYALSGISPFGLQTLASLRALDFLCDLKQVDERRIGIIGAGAGATQAWTAALLDERIRVIAPVNMLSSHYHGECECENGPLLRLNGLTSFDVLCACAPRPLLLPSATQDQTNLNPRYEIPALRKVYSLFDADDALLSFQIDALHNFNQKTREHLYPWFTHWLLNQSLRKSIPEDKLEVPPPEKMRITPNPPKPTDASTKQLLNSLSNYLTSSALPAVSAIPDISTFIAERKDLVGAIVNNEQNLGHISCRVQPEHRWSLSKGEAQGILVSRRERGDLIPAVRFIPANASRQKPACLLLAEEGKQDFFSGGNHATLLDTLLGNNCYCLAADIIGCGETVPMLEKSIRNESDSLFYSFNQSLFAMRVQDILSLLTLMHEDGFERIVLVASGNTLKPALAALAITKPIFGAVLNFDGQKDDNKDWLLPLNFQPMIRKAGGMTGLTALANTRILGLYKPEAALADYVTAFSAKTHVPQHVTIGRESFLRMLEYVVCNFNQNA